MRFEISRSLNGDKVMYIARDTNGIVRLRDETEEGILEAINRYNEMLIAGATAEDKSKSKSKKSDEEVSVSSAETTIAEGVSLESKEEDVQDVEKDSSEETVVPTPVPDNSESQKKFLHSDIKDQIEEKKKRSRKKTFWDKLK
jgi:hypothetical protein